MKKPLFILIIIVCSALFFALSYRGIVYMQEKVAASEKVSATPVYKINVVDVADTPPDDVEALLDDYEYGTIDYSQYFDDVEPTVEVKEQDVSQNEISDENDIVEDIVSEDNEVKDESEFIIMTVQLGKGTLNLRQSPNKDSKVIYDLENNSKVKVYPDSLTDGFYKIYVDDDTIGWASATYIK